MTRIRFSLTIYSLLMCCVLPIHAQEPATTSCAYAFTSGIGNTFLNYCVTVNGNIPQITTPFGHPMIDVNGEGYGICDQNIMPGGINYTDYAVSDTGNWKPALLVSKTLSSVKMARTTSDGNWTLTQTITRVSNPPSITVVMALTNHQSVSDVGYLVRFADARPDLNSQEGYFSVGSLNGAMARSVHNADPQVGLLLLNVGTPQFGYWQGFAQSVSTGPNACAFAFNEGFRNDSSNGSIEVAYVGTVLAGQTRTATLTYRSF